MKVLIAGGGIGGIAAALCLAKNHFQVSVFEQSPEFAEIGAGIQLSPNCTRVLIDLGLQEKLEATAFVPAATQFRNWRTGRIIAESPLGDVVLERFGSPYYHIHRGDLLRVLVQAAEQAPNVTLHTAAHVRSFVQDGDGVRIAVGDVTHEGDVLVGADGIHSVVSTLR